MASSPSSSPAASPRPPRHPLVGTLLWLLEETNIVVTSATALWLVARPSATRVWFIGGAVGSMVVAKVLKRLIREVRPPTHLPSSTTAKLLARSRSRPSSPSPSSSSPSATLPPAYGMPSTHSTTISFYATSLLVHSLHSSPVAALAGSAYCATIAWSRVALGHHSWAQVGAGVALGAALGVAHWSAWFGFGGWEGVMPAAEGGWALVEHVVGRVRAQM